MAASVTLSATPATRTVNAGQTAAYTININRDNYTDRIMLSISNLPPGAPASFGPNPAAGGSSILTVTTRTTTPAGTYKLKITGSAQGVSIMPIQVTLVVKPAPTFDISVLPSTLSIIAGQAATADIYIARSNYDGPVILEAKNVPEGVTVTFSENPATGNRSTARIYSHGMPHLWEEYDFKVEARTPDLVRDFGVRLLVNCGIEWVDQFGTAQGDFARDIVRDNSGNVYVAGETYVPGQNTTDIWVAKYTSYGQLEWLAPFGTDAEDKVTEIAVDASGNIFVGGYTFGTFPNENSQGGFDLWIAKYSNSGAQQWLTQDGTQVEDGAGGFVIVPDGAGGGKLTSFFQDRRFVRTYSFNGGNGNLTFQNGFTVHAQYREIPKDLAVGPNDAVYIVGRIAVIGNAQNREDGYVVKYDSQGNRQWDRNITYHIEESGVSVALDTSGNAFVVGSFGVEALGLVDRGAWIAKYDAGTGSELWRKIENTLSSTFGQFTSDDSINAIAVNSSGDVITAGATQGVLGERNGDASPVNDAWLARRNGSTGDLVWVRQFPVADIDAFNAVAAAGTNDILLAGYTVDFDQANIGSEDALVMRFANNSILTPPAVIRPPSITGLSPNTASVGETIRINGSFLFSTIAGVRFNGTAAYFSLVSSTAIDAIVPSGATTGLVTISYNCGSTSSPMPFTVTP